MSRKLQVFVVLALAGAGIAAAWAQSPPKFELILLGTGFPRPDPERAGPSTAILVGEKLFVVDAGRGVTLRLAAAGIPLKNIQAVLLTHLHSDHTSGLPDLFNTSWIFGRRAPLQLYGPRGTKDLAEGILRFFREDIRIRRDLTEKHPAAGATIQTHIVQQGVVYQDSDVRVTAFIVDHRPVEPAFGYRFECGGRTIIISGDTRPNENLVRYARGADILVLEAYLPEHFDRVDTPEVAARLKAYHTSAEQAGQVAQQAGVKTLVLTHLIPGNADQTFHERASNHFSGKIIVGRDLLRLTPWRNGLANPHSSQDLPLEHGACPSLRSSARSVPLRRLFLASGEWGERKAEQDDAETQRTQRNAEKNRNT